MSEEPKRTTLYEEHVRCGARIVPFAGFAMPVQYSGVMDEHLTVRRQMGLFDVSHMGELEIDGPDAAATVDRLTPNRALGLKVGQAQYSALLTERGTFVDDILVYRRGEQRFLLVVNASNIDKDFAWVTDHADGDVRIEDKSDDWGLLALQGPDAVSFLQPLCSQPIVDLGSFHFIEGAGVTVAGVPALVSRTGYTGEDGFELYVRSSDAPTVWRALLDEGAAAGIKPCGLGARDTLRLEARLPLYGNDIDDQHTPLQAGLSFIVKLDKGDFIGREVLQEQKENGVTTKLAGFQMDGREIGRHGYPVFLAGAEAGDEASEQTGEVTSGTRAPFLETNIGLTYLPTAAAKPGTELQIEIRNRRATAKVVRTPFYKRPKS